ncbi:MAG: MraY family glycosyltransferase [Elusimicrobiota bacterium]
MKKIIYLFLLTAFIYLVSPFGGTLFYIHGIRWVYVLLISSMATYLLMPPAISIGHRAGLLDHPDEERKIHKIPIPTTGGIAVFIAFFLTLTRNLNMSTQVKGILLAVLLIFISCILDDIFKLSATLRLLIQIAATTILIVFGIRVTVIPNGFFLKDALDIGITYFGVLGITNAFNYMDGMNGEAAGLAIVSGLSLFFIALSNGARQISWLAIGLVGCCLGFLPYNFPRAKVFLGDNGSNIIGFLLAAIAIAGSWSAVNPAVAVATPLLIFSIYIFDMTYTTVSRIKNGSVRNLRQWFAVTGKDHFHHRLVNLGFAETHSVIIIWGCAAIFSFSAFVIRKASWLNASLIMLQCMFIYFLIVVLMLAGREKYAEMRVDISEKKGEIT